MNIKEFLLWDKTPCEFTTPLTEQECTRLLESSLNTESRLLQYFTTPDLNAKVSGKIKGSAFSLYIPESHSWKPVFSGKFYHSDNKTLTKGQFQFSLLARITLILFIAWSLWIFHFTVVPFIQSPDLVNVVGALISVGFMAAVMLIHKHDVSGQKLKRTIMANFIQKTLHASLIATDPTRNQD